MGKPLKEYLSLQEAIHCGLGQTGARRCQWLEGTNICGAAESLRKRITHGNAIKPPRDEHAQSLCPNGIGKSNKAKNAS
jgi:hypothetical protein